MNKNFVKNPSFIIITIFAVSVVAGIAVVFGYRQPDSSNLTATISSGEVAQVEPVQEPVAEAVQEGELQPRTEFQIQEEEPKVVSEPQVSKPKVTNPSSNPIIRNTNPGSSNITVSPSSVVAGESVTVTVSVPGSGDLSTIWQTDVYLESPTGRNTVQGSIVSIDGEGRRFGNIVIPQGAELGAWIVKTVENFDNTGGITSYHYGTDIFTIFTLVAPQ